jgi:hypothetical protein
MAGVVFSRRPTHPRAGRPTSKLPSAATTVGKGARAGRGGGRADDPPGEDTLGAAMPTARSSTRAKMDVDESMRTTFGKVALAARGMPGTTVPPPRGRMVTHRPRGHPWELEGGNTRQSQPEGLGRWRHRSDHQGQGPHRLVRHVRAGQKEEKKGASDRK